MLNTLVIGEDNDKENLLDIPEEVGGGGSTLAINALGWKWIHIKD